MNPKLLIELGEYHDQHDSEVSITNLSMLLASSLTTSEIELLREQLEGAGNDQGEPLPF